MPAQASGGFVLYLSGALACLMILGMGATQWRRLATRDYQHIALAAGALMATCLASAAVMWVRDGTPMPCLAWAVTGLTITLITWAFQQRAFPSARAASISLIVGSVITIVPLGGCLMIPATRRLVTELALPVAVLILNAAGLILWLRQRRPSALWLGGGYVVLGAGVGAALMGQGQILLYTLTAALCLFVIETYHLVLADLTSYGDELRIVSEAALQQTEHMAFLLEVARAVGASLDLCVVLDRVAEATAHGVNADWAYILTHEHDSSNDGSDGDCGSASERLVVVARYGWWGRRGQQDGRVMHRTVVNLSDYSMMRHAIFRRRQLLANRPEDYEQFESLHEALQRPQTGPTLVQPIYAGERPLGVILLGRVGRQRPFSDEDGRLCQALTGQVAAAIDNARLHQSVDEQASRLADLLRIREEEAMQRQAILESITDGVVVAGEHQSVVIANAAAERILGLPRERLLGQTIKRLYAELWRAGTSQGGDCAVFKWGHKEVTGSLAPVKMPDGTLLGYVAVFRDVTRERQAELAKAQFIETVSHELRTPMTSIKGYVELLSAGAAGSISAQQRHFLGIAGANTDRMVSMVNNLITMSEMDRGALNVEPKRVDLGNLVREAVSAIRDEAEQRDLDVSVTVPPNLAAAWGDPQQLRQVMDNLLDNAVRYTPRRGRISVWATEAHLDEEDYVRTELVVSVRDTGVGIREEDQEHIFEKFFRGDNALSIEAGGTGVGLAIVQSLVHAHGGKVWVESAPGMGSTFTFTVPAEEQLKRKQ